MSKSKLKIDQLARLRQFRPGDNVDDFLSTQFRQILRALEQAYVSVPDQAQAAPVSSGILGSVGEMKLWPGAAIPANAFSCDGTLYNAVDYPALAEVFWDTTTGKWAWGGTGSYPTGQFRVPDMRGVVPRGVDGAAGRDPDKASRTAIGTNGNTGNNVGSYQGDQLASHSHQVPHASLSGVASNLMLTNGDPDFIVSTAATGGNETRGKNAYVNYIIIYQ